MMTPKELADALENIDEEAFASLLLEYELNHDDGPKQVKTMSSMLSVFRTSTDCVHRVRRSMKPIRSGRPDIVH